MDDYSMAEEDYENDSPKKGGHSLRKRARVDYTFEQIDDDIDFSSAISGPASASASASASAPRNRRRRPDSNGFDSEDHYSSGLKRRGASVDADTPSSRRRNPARKTSEARAYKDEFDDDEKDVQDTIEVGVLYSDSEKSDSVHMDISNASSMDLSVDAPQKPTPALSGSQHHDSDLKPTDHAAAEVSANSDVNPSAEPPANAAGSASGSASASAAADTNMPRQESDRASLPDSAAPASTTAEKTAEPQPKVHEVDATHTFSDKMAAPKSYTDELKSPRSSTPQNAGSTVNNNNDREGEPRVQPVQMSSTPSTPPPAMHATAEANNTALTHAAENDTPAEETAYIKPLNQLPEKEIPQENPEAPSESDTHPQPQPQPQPQSQPESQAQAQPQEPPYYPSAAAHLIALTAPSVPQPKIQVQAEEAQKQQTPELQSKASSPPPITVTAPAKDEADGTPASPSTSALGSTTLDASQSTSTDTTCVEPRVSLPEDGADAIVGPPLPEIQVQVETTVMKPADQAPPFQPSEQGPSKPQPRPEGRWAHLTPYIDGEYVAYPERKTQQEDEVTTGEDQTADDREANDMEPMVDDNDDIPDAAGIEAPTPALNTPLRGSPMPDSIDPTASNSPAAGGDDGEDVDVTEEPPERNRSFRYRKLRDPNEYLAALGNLEEMSTEDLYEVLGSINISLVQWQTEWNGLGKIVDDYENSLRRRVADVKYESRTRNFHQHGVNYEEPEFVVKGYRSKDREGMTETRYLQNQDRIMAAAYGFEYDPHPSKIGRQNPETQQAGIMTRGRSLRNQPKPTAKATETDEVTGKRQRKPVQLFDPATQDVSRSSTPVPTTRPRRRRTANADNDESQVSFATSFNSEAISDDEGGDGRRRRNRAARPKTNVPSIVEELVSAPPSEDSSVRETPSRSGRNKRVKQAPKYDEDPLGYHFVEEEPPKRRHLLTLKIPKGKNISEPSSAITDNGDSRPSTADSDSTSHTAESSYSFRPKRQKRFRDDAEESEEASQAPSKKRNKRINVAPPPVGGEEFPVLPEMLEPEAALGPNRKIQKIKVVRTTPASRKGTPSSLPNGEEAEEPPKDYKSMTKSEKMSASMKSKYHAVEARYIFRRMLANTLFQVAGPMATWLVLWRSERQPSLRKRPRRQRLSRGLVLSLPSPR